MSENFFASSFCRRLHDEMACIIVRHALHTLKTVILVIPVTCPVPLFPVPLLSFCVRGGEIPKGNLTPGGQSPPDPPFRVLRD